MDPVRHPLPSTYDCFPSISGAQDDPVLDTLHNAMERYAENGVYGTYVGWTGEVCAGGALMVGDPGLIKKAVEYAKNRGLEIADEEHPQPGVISRFLDAGKISVGNFDAWATDATKEAIKLLNEAAEELYAEDLPAMMEHQYPFGPLEWLNEQLPTDEEDAAERGLPYFRDAVLKVYKHAIAKREGVEA